MENENGNGNFVYSYRAPTQEERREIEGIRREYSSSPSGGDKLARLRALDERVKRAPRIVGLCFGTVGLLLFGAGLALCLQWGAFLPGVLLSAVGVAAMAGGYGLYDLLLKRGKKKYGAEILSLSEELLGDGRRNDAERRP